MAHSETSRCATVLKTSRWGTIEADARRLPTGRDRGRSDLSDLARDDRRSGRGTKVPLGNFAHPEVVCQIRVLIRPSAPFDGEVHPVRAPCLSAPAELLVLGDSLARAGSSRRPGARVSMRRHESRSVSELDTASERRQDIAQIASELSPMSRQVWFMRMVLSAPRHQRPIDRSNGVVYASKGTKTTGK